MKLIENWTIHLRKSWSIRLAALFAALAATIVASPGLLLGLIGFVPEEWRTIAAALTGIIAFVLPTLSRLTSQPKLEAAVQEKQNAAGS